MQRHNVGLYAGRTDARKTSESCFCTDHFLLYARIIVPSGRADELGTSMTLTFGE